MNSSDWASTAPLATAAGTLVLAVPTFAAVRSANRAAQDEGRFVSVNRHRNIARPDPR